MDASIMSLATKIAAKKGIPPTMLVAQINKESRGNPKALGDGGKSRGLMQIHENTAVGALGMKASDLPKLFDPAFNIDKGTDYLLKVKRTLQSYLPSDLIEAWGMIFMGYNSGPGYMLKALQKLRAEGNHEPKLQDAVNKMQEPTFGKRPIFSITLDYAKSIVGPALKVVTSNPIASGISGTTLLLGVVTFLYLKNKNKTA